VFTADKTAVLAVANKLKTFVDRQAEPKPHPQESVEEKGSSLAVFVKEFVIWLTSLDVTWKDELAANLFLLASHPLVDSTHCGLWTSSLKRLGVNPARLVEDHTPSLISASLSTCPHTLPVSVLVQSNEVVVVPLVMERLMGVLASDELLHVSQEEVDILNTPPNQLQDKPLYDELIASLTGGVGGSGRKESKSYGSKDQQWEAEVKAEMVRKKLGGLKDKGVREVLKLEEVDKKLREIVSSRLDKEEEIRSEMIKRRSKAEWSVSCLRAVMHTTSNLLLLGLPKLMNTIMEGLGSPLLNNMLQEVWVEATKLTFRNSPETGDMLGWLTIQLLYPNCQPRRHWGEEHVLEAVERVLDRLLAEQPSSVHWFRSALPFVRHALQSSEASWRTPDLVSKSVNVIHSASLGLRDCPAGDAAVFPVAETLYLVIQLMMSFDVRSLPGDVQKTISEIHYQLCQGISDIGPTPRILQVMIEGLYSTNRNICLTSLSGLHQFLSHLDQNGTMGKELVAWILVCRHDNNTSIAALANKLWDEAGMTLSSDLGHTLITVLSGSLTHIHTAAAKSLALFVKAHPQLEQDVIETLLKEYNELYQDLTPVTNEVGRVVGEPLPDPWEGRLGVARGLEHVAPHISAEVASLMVQFMIPQGLGDRQGDVRAGMLAGCLAVLGAHEEALSEKVMRLCEVYLSKPSDTEQSDLVRQSIVVVMGTLAKNLSKDDPRVKAIIHQLLSNLDTPSQQVQESISACLSPLMSAVKDEAAEIVTPLLNKLLESKSYAQRKGAAYGIAGVVKGLGIPSLKQHSVMQTIQTAVANKKNYKHREGALLVIEQLTVSLGRLFEPYVVKLLPHLLNCYGDGNQYVREATVEAARAIMSRLSGHGVKLILPDLLKGLEDDSWRTKAGSAELLGAMAHCAPKQLSSCLPSIVPSLGQILNDSHVKVQLAGTEALKEIGSVIKNPEIQALVPTLLQGIADPSGQTNSCLQTLLATEFVHMVDAPSLALIMPILQQALGLRSSEGKKMAAQIIGNMYQLTDPKDLSPYLSGIVPGLKESLVDPVPDVRSNSAVALGAMVKGLGEEAVADLLPWLFTTLQSENSSVDRSGAAQGLSEVIRAQGPENLSTMMPKFVSAVMGEDAPPQVRDGYLMLFIYLPAVMEEEFLPYIGSIIPCILQVESCDSHVTYNMSIYVCFCCRG
jgi:HEAT repeat protein